MDPSGFGCGWALPLTYGCMGMAARPSLGHGSAGAGERLGPDDVGVPPAGRKGLAPGPLAPGLRLLDTDSFHCLSSPRPVTAQARRGGLRAPFRDRVFGARTGERVDRAAPGRAATSAIWSILLSAHADEGGSCPQIAVPGGGRPGTQRTSPGRSPSRRLVGPLRGVI